jgi:hypothetical protein
MPFYPFVEIEGFRSFVVLHNFSPNNWELAAGKKKCVNLTWIENGLWKTNLIDYLSYGESKKYYKDNLALNFECSEGLVLLSLSDEPLLTNVISLPDLVGLSTSYPNWRSTIGLESRCGAITSYQGEIEPFPSNGSLLTIGNMFQDGPGIKNHLLLLNLEKAPSYRSALVSFYDLGNLSDSPVSVEVKSNCVNAIPIDDLPFLQKAGIVVVSKNMSAIPLYLSVLEDGEALSFEHTHPPASLVTLGPRWPVQARMKKDWFSFLGVR